MKTPHTDSYICLRNELGYCVAQEDAEHMRKMETLHNDAFARWQTCEAARGRIEDERNAAVETMVRKQENNFGLHRRNVRLETELCAAKCTLAKWIEWARMHGHLEHAAGIADEARRALDSQNV